jgi:hypothetical protein
MPAPGRRGARERRKGRAASAGLKAKERQASATRPRSGELRRTGALGVLPEVEKGKDTAAVARPQAHAPLRSRHGRQARATRGFRGRCARCASFARSHAPGAAARPVRRAAAAARRRRAAQSEPQLRMMRTRARRGRRRRPYRPRGSYGAAARLSDSGALAGERRPSQAGHACCRCRPQRTALRSRSVSHAQRLAAPPAPCVASAERVFCRPRNAPCLLRPSRPFRRCHGRRWAARARPRGGRLRSRCAHAALIALPTAWRDPRLSPPDVLFPQACCACWRS